MNEVSIAAHAGGRHSAAGQVAFRPRVLL
jgi:hypothetical protein